MKKKNPIPKIKKKKTIKMVIVKWSSLAIIAIGILILLALSPLFNIKQVNIVNITKNEGGEYKVLEEEISGIVDIPDTQNIFKLDYKEIIAKIKNSNTYIENVEIKKELPNAITITIEERKPRYIIEIEDKNVYIDSKGNILEISETKIDVPKIVGYETSIENIIDYKNTKVLSENDCKKLERVNQVYDAAKNNGILYCVTSIDITKIDDIKLILEEEYKTVYLGDCSNANLRILYLKTMIEKETGKEGEAFINGDMRTLTPKPYFREKV